MEALDERPVELIRAVDDSSITSVSRIKEDRDDLLVSPLQSYPVGCAAPNVLGGSREGRDAWDR